MSELSAGAKALLDAAKRAPSSPSEESVDRMEREVLVAVGLTAASGAAGAAATKGVWSGVLVKVLVGTTLLVVGGVVGAALVWNRSLGEREPSVAVSPPPIVPREVVGPVPAPVVVPAPAPVPAPTPAPAPVAVKKPREVPPRAAVVPSPLVPPSPPPVFPAADELALLRAALRHLDAREWKEALAELDRRDLEFPAGALQDEADVLRVLGLCGLDQVSAATALAARLRVRAPNSPALARLSTACVNP